MRTTGTALAFIALALTTAVSCSDDDDSAATSTVVPTGVTASTSAVPSAPTPPAASPDATSPVSEASNPAEGGTTVAAGTTTQDVPPSYTPGPCPNPIAPLPTPLDLGDNIECGYLTVPESRSRPTGRTVRIPVARARAASTNPRPDPIVYLAGGPGGSGLSVANAKVQAGWNADRDVIFIDQRGTLKSEPLLACPEVDAFQVTSVGLLSTDPATSALARAATQTCHDRLVAEGWDLSAFDTAENAADLADLRVAMGIEEWNLYGVSYGTDLALQTLRDHPEGIRSVVLDSVVPPQPNLIEQFWPNAAKGFEALFAACAVDVPCDAAFPDLATDFTTLVNELTATPLTVTLTTPTGATTDVVIDGFTLANLVVVASLTPGTLAPMPKLINDLSAGDGTAAAQTVLAGATGTLAGLTGYGLSYGVFCRESIAFTDEAQLAATAREALPDFPDVALSNVPQFLRPFQDCDAWDAGRADPSVREPARSEVPALLLAGELDAITPPAWAELAAETLPNSTLLRFPGSGHDITLWNTECAVAVMNNFLDQPGGGWDDSCVVATQAPPFTT